MAIGIFHARQRARQLERAFPGFGAAVAEKGFIQAGDFGQPLRQLRLIFMEEQIRHVNQPAGLLFQNVLNRGMRMAQRIHSHPAQEVEILLSLGIPQIDAAAVRKQHALAVVGGQQQLLLGAGYGGQAHAAITSVPQSSLVK